jgi:uncharacterized membrane protein YhaH (DUF805 family)
MNWYREALRQYATFEGRARRKEYWYFALGNGLAIGALAFIDGSIGTFDHEARIGLLSGLYALAVFIPGLAVSVRRLHDTNRSAWWLLVDLVPFAGWIVMLVLVCLDSQPGGNRYGPNPKGVLGAGTPSPIVVRDLTR